MQKGNKCRNDHTSGMTKKRKKIRHLQRLMSKKKKKKKEKNINKKKKKAHTPVNDTLHSLSLYLSLSKKKSKSNQSFVFLLICDVYNPRRVIFLHGVYTL